MYNLWLVSKSVRMSRLDSIGLTCSSHPQAPPAAPKHQDEAKYLPPIEFFWFVTFLIQLAFGDIPFLFDGVFLHKNHYIRYSIIGLYPIFVLPYYIIYSVLVKP